MSQSANGCLPCSNCFVTVPQDRWYAVEKFGRYHGMLSPGLSFAGPDCLGVCIQFRSITSRVEQILCSVSTKTQDNVFVTSQVAVQYSVSSDNVEAAMYKLTNVSTQIDSYVSDVVRSQVPQMTLDEAFEKKDDISNAIQDKLVKEMFSFGFVIHKSLVTELTPNAEVVQSMNEINKQRRLRDASIMAAEAEKIKVVKAAEAAADAAQLQGEGIARQRRAIIDGLRDSITAGSDETLSTQKVSELLLITQYFETLRDIAASSKAQVVFLPHSAGAVADVASQVRGGLASSAPAQAQMGQSSGGQSPAAGRSWFGGKS